MKGYQIKSSDWESIYPIGSIYTSVNSTSPASLFGGTWEQIKDKFLLCSGNTYSGGNSGGSATINLNHTHSTSNHTLTEAQIPSHCHQVSSRMYSNGASNGSTFNIAGWGSPASGSNHYIINIQGTAASLSSGSYVGALNTGGGQAHNHGNTGSSGSSSQSIMPPYLAVYVWKRTA